MATYVTDDGICLRVTDFSETSQIVAMFTRRHGMVPLIAKGAKRQSKRNVMSGPLDLLTSGEVVFVPAREGGGAAGAGGGAGGGGAGWTQLGTMAEWQLADHRRELRGNLAALNAAMICAEVTTHLVHSLDPHEELFAQLEAALELLGHSREAGETGRVLVAYVKAALVAAGYWPQMGKCLGCGRAVGDAPVRFSVRAGGVLCTAGATGGACHVENAGTTISVAGKIALGLERLVSPVELKARPPERAADAVSLATAMQLLLAQVEAVTDKGVRTRQLLKSVFAGQRKKKGSPEGNPFKNS